MGKGSINHALMVISKRHQADLARFLVKLSSLGIAGKLLR